MKAYKGFNRDMTCRGFQYEIGKEYETKKASLCNEGFHACENPLDCFRYYRPGTSKYHEVEIDDNGERHSDDSKVVGKRIKIGAELDVAKICNLHFEYVSSKCVPAKSKSVGDSESSSAGNYGAASAGNYGAASAGNYGAASAGESGAASAGESGAASAGNYGAASAGNYGAAVSRGSSAVAKYGVAVVRGDDVKAKGGIGSVLVICIENNYNYDIEYCKTAIVDGVDIKADTFYTLDKDGNFVEVE